MKIAVSAQGPDLTSAADPHFGRAKQFVVVDTETGAVAQAVDNAQNVNAARGAGVQAAQTVAELGVEAVISGNCGPNAFRTLSAADIKVFTGASGTVADAVEQFKAGTLTAADDATVQGGWGLT